MAEVTQSPLSLRQCPRCRKPLIIPEAFTAEVTAHCPSCGKRYRIPRAVVRQEIAAEPAQAAGSSVLAGRRTKTKPQPEPESPFAHPGPWAVGSLVAGVLVAVSTWLGRGVDGPTFLLYYAGVLFVTLITSTVLRSTWYDSWALSVLGAVAFEAVGALRIVMATQRGMHRFGFLWGMMIVGFVLFFLRVKENDSGFGIMGDCAGGWNSSSCSSGSSCGGGGCGGCGGS